MTIAVVRSASQTWGIALPLQCLEYSGFRWLWKSCCCQIPFQVPSLILASRCLESWQSHTTYSSASSSSSSCPVSFVGLLFLLVISIHMCMLSVFSWLVLSRLSWLLLLLLLSLSWSPFFLIQLLRAPWCRLAGICPFQKLASSWFRVQGLGFRV